MDTWVPGRAFVLQEQGVVEYFYRFEEGHRESIRRIISAAKSMLSRNAISRAGEGLPSRTASVLVDPTNPSPGFPPRPQTSAVHGSAGNGERLRAWHCFRENLFGRGRKFVHVAEKCYRLPNLLHC